MKSFLTALVLLGFSSFLHAQHTSAASEGNFYTATDSTKIYYEVRGKGKAVVLVHGFIVDGESWKPTALYNDLLKAGYKVITMDLRGNGKSDKPHKTEFYENDVEAADVMGLMTRLDINDYALIGYSRGSIISSRLLILDKRVNAAVLGGMGADFTNPQWPRRIMFAEALAGKPVKELEGLVKYVKDSGLDQEALALLQKHQPSTSPQDLAKVNKPVLVISGTEDTDNGSAKALAALIPKSTHVAVPGDHGSTAATTAFSAEVIKFLKR